MRKNNFKNLIYCFLNNCTGNQETNKQSHELLKRDLENCFDLKSIERIKEILTLCKDEFSENEFLTFLLNIDYRKQLIEYSNQFLQNKRYSTNRIKHFFVATFSYAVCDAILLHIEKNKQYYLSQHFNLHPMQSLDVFHRMATKQKTYIYDNYLLQKKYA